MEKTSDYPSWKLLTNITSEVSEKSEFRFNNLNLIYLITEKEKRNRNERKSIIVFLFC